MNMPNSSFLSWEKQWMVNDPLICKVLTCLFVLSVFFTGRPICFWNVSHLPHPCTVSCLLSPSPVNSLIFHYLWSPECVFELNRARGRTPQDYFPSPSPPLFHSLSASIFIYPFCDADLAACWPPQSAGSFGALRNDSTLSLSDLPACWLQLLLTNSQAESAPESCRFFLASFPLPGFTLPHIAPSVRDLFMPHLLIAPPHAFIFSPPHSCPHQIPTWAENRCQTGAVTVFVKVKFSAKSSF